MVLALVTTGAGNFAPNIGSIANQTVSHKNAVLVMHPIANPKIKFFFFSNPAPKTSNSFPIIITGIIKGIMFTIGVAPMKYATTGVKSAMNVPDHKPQYNVEMTKIQFTAEPVMYGANGEVPLND